VGFQKRTTQVIEVAVLLFDVWDRKAEEYMNGSSVVFDWKEGHRTFDT
jgi:hypothetical protein